MKKSLIIAALFFTACGGGTVKNYVSDDGKLHGELSLSGAFALYPLAVEWADEFKKNNPDVRVDVSAGGAGKGMTDVLAGMVDFGMVSREVYPPEIEKGAVGFPSIGCQPCTRAVKEGEDIRSGRWWWENPEHRECGLHQRT